MIGDFFAFILPAKLQVNIEKRRKFFSRHPLLWNSANILSVSRVLIFFYILAVPGSSQDAVIAWYVILSITDKLDGWVALLTGNNQGVGRYLDPLCDKIFQFMGMQYLLLNELIYPAILGYSAMFVEVAIFFNAMACVLCAWYGQGMSFRATYHVITEESAKGARVNPFGKVKMVAYFTGITFLLLYLYAPRFFGNSGSEYISRASPVFRNLYITFFVGGICMGLLSLRVYFADALRWHYRRRRMLSRAE